MNEDWVGPQKGSKVWLKIRSGLKYELKNKLSVAFFLWIGIILKKKINYRP